MSDEFLPRIGALCRPGTVIDAGANVGQYSTVLLSAKDCKVVAFEPFLPSFLDLNRKLAQIGGGKPPAHIVTYNIAVGAAFGTAQIAAPMAGLRVDHQAASLVKDFAEAQTVRQPVVIAPIDAFGLDPVTFMKIDVEGAEMEALRGAERTITASRPILLVELEERHRAGATHDVPAWLADRGYRALFYLDGKLVDFARLDRATMHVAPSSKPYINEFLFVHREDAWGQALLESGALDWA